MKTVKIIERLSEELYGEKFSISDFTRGSIHGERELITQLQTLDDIDSYKGLFADEDLKMTDWHRRIYIKDYINNDETECIDLIINKYIDEEDQEGKCLEKLADIAIENLAHYLVTGIK